MLRLSHNLSVFPVLHGSAACTLALRKHLQENRYAHIALLWPSSFAPELQNLCGELPVIHALVAEAGGERVYLPADPCDASIEAIRQGLFERRLQVHCIGPDRIPSARDASGLPDPWALEGLDPRAWFLAHLPFLAARPAPESPEWFAHVVVSARALASRGPTLVICHLSEYAALVQALELPPNASPPPLPAPEPMQVQTLPIKEKHLAFALQEIPFYAAFFERNRMDPLALLPKGNELVKSLLIEIRDRMEEEGTVMRIPTGRLATTLRYLRRLEVQENALSPSLYMLAVAVKGVLGDDFASRLVRYAQSYPFQRVTGQTLKVYPNATRLPWDTDPVPSRNLLRDTPLFWRKLALRRSPDWKETRQYQKSWNPHEACSHVPEDIRLERYNQEVRKQALRLHLGKRRNSEPFTASLQDGIDLRETLRHWHENRLYVKNEPPLQGRIDTAIFVFDTEHDERYPYQCTWYAEHDQESTLSFYSTDPQADLIGPGIGRGRYGGFSLVFPPVHFPDIFQTPIPMPADLRLHERLVYGTLMFAQQPLVAYVATQAPGLRLQNLAKKLGKTLIHVPLQTLGSDGQEKLRTFHMLNGKEIRSIARRFIGY